MKPRQTVDDVLNRRAAKARQQFEIPVMGAALAVLPVVVVEQFAVGGWVIAPENTAAQQRHPHAHCGTKRGTVHSATLPHLGVCRDSKTVGLRRRTACTSPARLQEGPLTEGQENPAGIAEALRTQEVLTTEEALARADHAYQDLLRLGGPETRDVEGRLAWKRARGIDTIVEERLCGLYTR